MTEVDSIPLSALNHWACCPRRCGLFHMEQEFTDNIHTARGNAEREKIDSVRSETSGDRRFETALPVWYDRVGLIGKCGVVEFLSDGTPYPHGMQTRPKVKSVDYLNAAQPKTLVCGRDEQRQRRRSASVCSR